MACFSLKQSNNDDEKDGAPEQSTEKDSIARREYVIHLLDQRRNSWNGSASAQRSTNYLNWTPRRGASFCPMRKLRARFSATKLTCTANSIAPWTKWSVGNGVVREKMYLRR